MVEVRPQARLSRSPMLGLRWSRARWESGGSPQPGEAGARRCRCRLRPNHADPRSCVRGVTEAGRVGSQAGWMIELHILGVYLRAARKARTVSDTARRLGRRLRSRPGSSLARRRHLVVASRAEPGPRRSGVRSGKHEQRHGGRAQTVEAVGAVARQREPRGPGGRMRRAAEGEAVGTRPWPGAFATARPPRRSC